MGNPAIIKNAQSHFFSNYFVGLFVLFKVFCHYRVLTVLCKESNGSPERQAGTSNGRLPTTSLNSHQAGMPVASGGRGPSLEQ
jgi:hypothetical protein